jgi:hypothetical protein
MKTHDWSFGFAKKFSGAAQKNVAPPIGAMLNN